MSELVREIQNGRLLKRNGSWMYCDHCQQTVGYLCYSGYQEFKFEFECACGGKGSFYLAYPSSVDTKPAVQGLKEVKNRLCCPVDNTPIMTIVHKRIKEMKYNVTCKKCQTQFVHE